MASPAPGARRGRTVDSSVPAPRTADDAHARAAVLAALPADVRAVVEDTEYLSTTQVAAILRVAKMTDIRLIESGELRAYRFRARSPFRIPVSALADLLRESGAVPEETP